MRSNNSKNYNFDATSKNKIKKVRAQHLIEIQPETDNQDKAIQYWDDGFNLVLTGLAGTGKTFMATYLALDDMLNESDLYHKVYFIRSAVSTRDQGFLPGDLSEKSEPYSSPYEDICRKLVKINSPSGKDHLPTVNSWEALIVHDQVEFVTTSFLRGETLENCIIIADEIQNMTFHELDTIITRMGENTRIIFCGDFHQLDFTNPYEKSGIHHFTRILECTINFKVIYFGLNDIVRSGMVRDYLLTKTWMQQTSQISD